MKAKPITPEEMSAYVKATWDRCQEQSWQEQQFRTEPRGYALDMVESGLVSADHLLLCALKYMSHDAVRGMLDANELSPRFLDEEV